MSHHCVSLAPNVEHCFGWRTFLCLRRSTYIHAYPRCHLLSKLTTFPLFSSIIRTSYIPRIPEGQLVDTLKEKLYTNSASGCRHNFKWSRHISNVYKGGGGGCVPAPPPPPPKKKKSSSTPLEDLGFATIQEKVLHPSTISRKYWRCLPDNTWNTLPFEVAVSHFGSELTRSFTSSNAKDYYGLCPFPWEFENAKKNTPVVLVIATAAFDRVHQWPDRFTQMYRPKERLLIYTLQTCDRTLLTAAVL